MSYFIKNECTPCKSGVSPLGKTEVESLIVQLQDWISVDNSTKIQKRINLPNFKNALELANKIGCLAEEQGHHPDIEFGWGYINITLQTHKINGLHENDFVLASKIDQVCQ